jgi:hypothetical protein
LPIGSCAFLGSDRKVRLLTGHISKLAQIQLIIRFVREE